MLDDITYSCWRCMERPVADPGTLCVVCWDHDERLLQRDSKKATSDGTHARNTIPFDDALWLLDKEAYRRWSDAQ